VPFEIIAVHLDQGQPGYDGAALEAWLCGQGYEHQIVRKDTYQVVTKASRRAWAARRSRSDIIAMMRSRP
jgi:hypothetical protein